MVSFSHGLVPELRQLVVLSLNFYRLGVTPSLVKRWSLNSKDFGHGSSFFLDNLIPSFFWFLKAVLFFIVFSLWDPGCYHTIGYLSNYFDDFSSLLVTFLNISLDTFNSMASFFTCSDLEQLANWSLRHCPKALSRSTLVKSERRRSKTEIGGCYFFEKLDFVLGDQCKHELRTCSFCIDSSTLAMAVVQTLKLSLQFRCDK